jgi:hypothetical protein
LKNPWQLRFIGKRKLQFNFLFGDEKPYLIQIEIQVTYYYFIILLLDLINRGKNLLEILEICYYFFIAGLNAIINLARHFQSTLANNIVQLDIFNEAHISQAMSL